MGDFGGLARGADAFAGSRSHAEDMASSIDCPPRPRRRAPYRAVVLVPVLLAVLGGCAAGTGTTTTGGAPTAGAPGTAGTGPGTGNTAQGRAGTGTPASPARIPGLGPRTRAWIPANARQVVVVTGVGKDANRSRVVLYRHTGAGWERGPGWPAHNALKGWTDDHWAGDLRSPVGVFTLTDAGGLLPDPGSRLPYDRSDGFAVGGTGFEGEPLEGSFDYVVAIDYNREPGTSPLDLTRPLGAGRGGGIWLHVDHGGPTQGCVSLSETHMKELLRTLDPGRHPVIVMGDAASLRE